MKGIAPRVDPTRDCQITTIQGRIGVTFCFSKLPVGPSLPAPANLLCGREVKQGGPAGSVVELSDGRDGEVE